MPDSTQQQNVITFENVTDIIGEIERAFYEIPFENSDFQNEFFVLGSQITPERAYRALGLKMMSKIQALREAKYGRLKDEIDLEELNDKINNPETNKYDVKRAKIDLAQRQESRSYANKLINDAIHELNILYSHFKNMPKYTRKQFEDGERNHFEQRLNRQLRGVQGAAESLANMNVDFLQIQKDIEQHKLLANT